jgi:hypothetical protein
MTEFDWAEENAEIEAEIMRGVAPCEEELAMMRMLVEMHNDDPKRFELIMRLLRVEDAEDFVRFCRKTAWS